MTWTCYFKYYSMFANFQSANTSRLGLTRRNSLCFAIRFNPYPQWTVLCPNLDRIIIINCPILGTKIYPEHFVDSVFQLTLASYFFIDPLFFLIAQKYTLVKVTVAFGVMTTDSSFSVISVSLIAMM